MDIPANQVKTKKRIGTLDGHPVIHLELIGGLHMVAGLKNGKPRLFGAAPVAGMARYLAEKAEPDMVLTELSKSEKIDLDSVRSLEPKYTALTNRINILLTEKFK